MSDGLWVNFSRDELQELLSPYSALWVNGRRSRMRRAARDKLEDAFSNGKVGHKLLADSFKDDRGKIQDLISGPIDAVTLIRTVKGAVRGNHLHKRTTQWTYLLSGGLRVSHNGYERIVEAGELFVEEPGVAHAWKAVEDSECLVFTKGPRSGDQYESDTFRLDEPLLS